MPTDCHKSKSASNTRSSSSRLQNHPTTPLLCSVPNRTPTKRRLWSTFWPRNPTPWKIWSVTPPQLQLSQANQRSSSSSTRPHQLLNPVQKKRAVHCRTWATQTTLSHNHHNVHPTFMEYPNNRPPC